MNVLRKLPKPVLLACGAGIYVSTTIVVYNYYNDKSDKSVSIKGPGCGCVKDISSAEREATYGKIAAKYDSGTEAAECNYANHLLCILVNCLFILF